VISKATHSAVAKDGGSAVDFDALLVQLAAEEGSVDGGEPVVSEDIVSHGYGVGLHIEHLANRLQDSNF